MARHKVEIANVNTANIKVLTNEEMTDLFIKYQNGNLLAKEELINGFEIIILYYKDILNNLLNKDPEIFVDYMEEIRRISNKNSLNQITRKLLVVNDLKEKIKFNANTNLLMDKLIIELEGGI